MNKIAFAIQVKAQRAQSHFCEVCVRQATDLDAKGGSSISGLDCGLQAVRSEPLGFSDGERPKRCVVAGSKFARMPFDRPGIEHRATRNGQSAGNLALLGVEMKLHYSHRGNGPDIMRV